VNTSLNNPFEYLVEACSRWPKAVAVSSSDGELSYEELLDSAVRFANVLRERGVLPGDLVAVRAPAVLDVVLSEALFHEAAIGGHIPVGFETEITGRFQWVVTTELISELAPEKQIVLDGTFFEHSTRVSAVSDPVRYETPETLCRVSFSSGTTGIPKAIGWSVDCLYDRSIDRMKQWMPDSPYLCLLGLPTGLAFMSFIAGIAIGQPYVVPAKREELASQVSVF